MIFVSFYLIEFHVLSIIKLINLTHLLDQSQKVLIQFKIKEEIKE